MPLTHSRREKRAANPEARSVHARHKGAAHNFAHGRRLTELQRSRERSAARDTRSAQHHDLGAAAGDAEVVVVDDGERAVAQQRHAFGLADDVGEVRGVEPQSLRQRP